MIAVQKGTTAAVQHGKWWHSTQASAPLVQFQGLLYIQGIDLRSHYSVHIVGVLISGMSTVRVPLYTKASNSSLLCFVLLQHVKVAGNLSPMHCEYHYKLRQWQGSQAMAEIEFRIFAPDF